MARAPSNIRDSDEYRGEDSFRRFTKAQTPSNVTKSDEYRGNDSVKRLIRAHTAFSNTRDPDEYRENASSRRIAKAKPGRNITASDEYRGNDSVKRLPPSNIRDSDEYRGEDPFRRISKAQSPSNITDSDDHRGNDSVKRLIRAHTAFSNTRPDSIEYRENASSRRITKAKPGRNITESDEYRGDDSVKRISKAQSPSNITDSDDHRENDSVKRLIRAHTAFSNVTDSDEFRRNAPVERIAKAKPGRNITDSDEYRGNDSVKSFKSKMENFMERQKIMCTICSAIGENAEAIMVCKESDCNEKLCEACTKRHKKQRATGSHKIIKLEDDSPGADEVFCELCQDEAVPGFGYCTDCPEPEVMCDKCCKRHTVSRKFQGHNISKKLESLKIADRQTACVKSLISNSNVNTNGNSEKQQASRAKTAVSPPEVPGRYNCEPCRFESKKVHAIHYCLDCEEPEPMCRPCGQQHLKQKVGRGHRLSESMQHFKSPQGTVHSSIRNIQQQFNGPTDIPGKPTAVMIKSDSVKLHWKRCDDVDCYQIRYKSKSGKENWKIIQTDVNKSELMIEGLMANTTYIFQVRGVKGDIEGSYSPANEDIKTQESLASYLLGFSVQTTSGNPSKFELPLKENPRARNEHYKIRQICLGDMTSRRNREDEKTIMLVGSTGSGKSTLVDGIVNYVMGVSFDDPFRFTLVKLEDDERRKTGNQAVSQTEWITVYKIAPHKGSRLDFTLNIIDTPGFGDTRGIDRDNNIVDQVRYLFSAKGDQGVLYLDSVCFIVKAPDARLTPVQRYIFYAIMSLFGKDIESNICTLITFADGADPPVLACLKEAKLPFGSTFQFNNSALFAVNKNLQSNALSPFFWEMGCKSFEAFFRHLKKFETRSLSQTKDVLHEREQLKTIISSIRPQISAGLCKLNEVREQLELFKKHANDIENNKDFTYEVEETRQYQRKLPPGQHVTNCLHCNITCHEDCRIADNSEKENCWAMTDGYCRICFDNCYWTQHKNTPVIFSYVTETITKTYQGMKDRYEKAIGETLTHEKYLEQLTTDVEELMDNLMDMMNEMNCCKTRLKEIALRPDPLSTVEHIDLMIQAEESERQPGYDKRIKMLEDMKRMALVDTDIQNFDINFRRTRNDVTSAVGKDFPGRSRIKSRCLQNKNPATFPKRKHIMKIFFGELL